MTNLKSETAIKEALEIAKVICANPSTKVPLNKESAENLADFIRTLETRFLNKDSQS